MAGEITKSIFQGSGLLTVDGARSLYILMAADSDNCQDEQPAAFLRENCSGHSGSPITSAPQYVKGQPYFISPASDLRYQHINRIEPSVLVYIIL